MWSKIFRYLQNEDLLACRMVSKPFQALIDDLFLRQIWAPYFGKNRPADPLSLFLIKCKGTRFNSVEDLELFYRMMEDESNVHDPFINQTLIIRCQTVPVYAQLCQRIPELIAKYGQYVKHCLYFVHHEVLDSVRNIPALFQLKNMVSLTIYCADWEKGGIKDALESSRLKPNEAPLLRYFSTLNILGDRGYLALKAMLPHYGPQIKRFYCWGHNFLEISRSFSGDVIRSLPNLEEFKISEISPTLISLLSAEANWPLKRLSIRVGNCNDPTSFGAIMGALRKFAGTLESFHLDIDRRQLHTSHGYEYSFPRLTELRVPFYFARDRSFELIEIRRRLKNLKHLHFIDSEDDPRVLAQRQGDYNIVMDQHMEPLWPQFPASVEDVTVRYRKQMIFARNRDEPGPIVHKYRKSRSQL